MDFKTLREANICRLPQFKNAKGEPAHSQPDGSDWSLAEWCNAVTGELGEAANLIKKVQRGDFTLEEARQRLADEFADIVIYLDILAMRAGVELGEAVRNKFNVVSTRVGANVFISENRKIGLKDISGNEIHEGDTIECDNYKMYGGKFTVMFHPFLLQWVGKIPSVHPVPICNMENLKIVNQ